MAQESVSVASVQLDNTVIRAPFAGVVVAKAAQPGEMISPISAGGGFTRTGIGTIVDMDSLEIQVDVNESFINRVTPGQPVEAMLNAYPDWKIPGEVIAIIPTADRSKATVKVRIALEHEGSAHRAGHGRARGVPRRRRRSPARSPRRSSRRAGAGRRPCGATARTGVVFVVAGDKVERAPVTLGRDAWAPIGRCSAACAAASAWCCRRRSRSRTATPSGWPRRAEP